MVLLSLKKEAETQAKPEGRITMKKRLQQILSLLCILALALGCVTTAALAEQQTESRIIAVQWEDGSSPDDNRPEIAVAYSAAGFSTTLNKANEWKAEVSVTAGTTGDWTWTTPVTDQPGNAITPKGGVTYYIKEVPADKYLQPYFHYTYKKGIEGEPIVTAWLISDLDDQNYTESGFVIVDAKGKAKICSSLTVQNAVGGNTIKLTAKRIFGVDGSGLLTYRRVIENYAGINGFGDGAKILQYWVTPDGLIVTGTTSRVYTGTAGKTGISCTPTPVSSTIRLPSA